MTDRASVHTGNASKQFLHRNRTLILVHTALEQLLKRSKTYPVQCEHSLNELFSPAALASQVLYRYNTKPFLTDQTYFLCSQGMTVVESAYRGLQISEISTDRPRGDHDANPSFHK